MKYNNVVWVFIWRHRGPLFLLYSSHAEPGHQFNSPLQIISSTRSGDTAMARTSVRGWNIFSHHITHYIVSGEVEACPGADDVYPDDQDAFAVQYTAR